jgi:hypothetical protein
VRYVIYICVVSRLRVKYQQGDVSKMDLKFRNLQPEIYSAKNEHRRTRFIKTLVHATTINSNNLWYHFTAHC